MTLLTVPIRFSGNSRIGEGLFDDMPEADAYEIWLDSLPKEKLEPEVIELLVRGWKAATKKKLVVVCKGKPEKTELLIAAANAGADYVDIGLDAGKKNIERLIKNKKKAKIIISFHDFKKTPTESRLKVLAKKMFEMGADVAKLACFVNSLADNGRLMEFAQLLQEKNRKHIIIGMGEKGLSTRIFGEKLGNELNFVSHEMKTAPGQVSLEQMRKFQKVLR